MRWAPALLMRLSFHCLSSASSGIAIPGCPRSLSMNPSSDIDMYRMDFAMRSPSSGPTVPRGLQRPCQPVERVRHTAAVLVAQLVGREAPLNHRHYSRPVSGRERELGAEGEPRPI